MPDRSGTAAVSVRQVWKIFGEPAQEALAAARDEGAGKAEILKRFGAVLGLRDVSFDLRAGETLCILGLPGSGKSTLLRHINRLVEPTDGQILIHDEDVGGLSREELRNLRADRIGMVFPFPALLPHRTVRDNLSFVLELRGVDTYTRINIADRILRSLSLEGSGDRMPGELSNAVQRRLGLARALAADPEILLMDEPFATPDPQTRRALLDEFLAWSRQVAKTTIFATRDLGEAIRLGSRTAILKDGEIVQTGPPEQILTDLAGNGVTDFTRGLSRLKQVFAHTLMIPPEQYAAENGGSAAPQDWPQATPGTDLNSLVDIVIGRDSPVAVMDSDRLVGVVTKDALLRGIRGDP